MCDEPRGDTAVWNSLEVAKLAVSIFQAILSAAIAIAVFYVAQNFSAEQADRSRLEARSVEVIKRRFEIWKAVGPKLYDIWGYTVKRGRWRSLRAADIIGLKRDIDAEILSDRPLLTRDFVVSYGEFVRTVFSKKTTEYGDPRIRTENISRNPQEDSAMLDPANYNQHAVNQAYKKLLLVTAKDFGEDLNDPDITMIGY